MRKYMVCVVGEERFAVPLSQVREVSSLSKITPLPGLPPSFLGLVNLRGNIIGAIDLGLKLGMKPFRQTESAVEKSKESRTCYVIVEHEGRQIALRVHEIEEVVAVRPEDIDSQIERLEAGARKGISGVAKTSEAGLIMLLDVAKVVEGTERLAA